MTPSDLEEDEDDPEAEERAELRARQDREDFE